ncbi:MAG TPA: GAF domain-containing protein [Ramlibacter sp.]
METQASAASRLHEIARSIAFATTAGSTDHRLDWLTPYLADVRQALGMEVAFVAQLVDDRRVFRVVSTVPDSTAAVDVGRSDRLLDTYCMYVVQGRLPPVIRDIRNLSHEAALLPITERLGIGCYVSAPVVLPDGQTFGTLCCFSRGARPDLVDSDGDALRDVARAIGESLIRQGVPAIRT